MKKRIGRFYLHYTTESDFHDYLPIMAKCFVIRAEYLWDRGMFGYIAYSDLFDEVKEGDLPPEYEVIVEGGEVSVSKIGY